MLHSGKASMFFLCPESQNEAELKSNMPICLVKKISSQHSIQTMAVTIPCFSIAESREEIFKKCVL